MPARCSSTRPFPDLAAAWRASKAEKQRQRGCCRLLLRLRCWMPQEALHSLVRLSSSSAAASERSAHPGTAGMESSWKPSRSWRPAGSAPAGCSRGSWSSEGRLHQAEGGHGVRDQTDSHGAIPKSETRTLGLPLPSPSPLWGLGLFNFSERMAA